MIVQRIISTIIVLLLLLGLVSVRAFETPLFQDPLSLYFKGDFHTRSVPEISLFNQIALTSFRFLLNTVLSLWILWFLYKKESFINAALYVYLIAFVLLTLIFLLLLNVESDFGKMALFYTRRFLIHPVLLFVLVAGFYFLERKATD